MCIRDRFNSHSSAIRSQIPDSGLALELYYVSFYRTGRVGAYSFADSQYGRVLANRGYYMTPHIVRPIEGANNQVEKHTVDCDPVSYTHLDVYKRQVFTE